MKLLNCFSLVAGLAFAMQSTLHAQYVNEGFESPVVSGVSEGTTPDGWGWTATGNSSLRNDGITSTIAHSGSQSLYFTTSSTQGAGFESIYLHGTPYGGLSLSAGDQWTCSVWVRSDALNPYSGDCVFVCSMEFHDSLLSGNPAEGAATMFVSPSQMSTSSWTEFSVTGSPTAFADNLFFVLKQSNYSGSAYTSSSGTFYVDDLQASAVPEPGFMALAGLGMFAVIAFRRRPV